MAFSQGCECGYGAGGEWVSVCQNGLYTYYVDIARVLSVKKANLAMRTVRNHSGWYRECSHRDLRQQLRPYTR